MLNYVWKAFLGSNPPHSTMGVTVNNDILAVAVDPSDNVFSTTHHSGCVIQIHVHVQQVGPGMYSCINIIVLFIFLAWVISKYLQYLASKSKTKVVYKQPFASPPPFYHRLRQYDEGASEEEEEDEDENTSDEEEEDEHEDTSDEEEEDDTSALDDESRQDDNGNEMHTYEQGIHNTCVRMALELLGKEAQSTADVDKVLLRAIVIANANFHASAAKRIDAIVSICRPRTRRRVQED
jgi:hypothetical protein